MNKYYKKLDITVEPNYLKDYQIKFDLKYLYIDYFVFNDNYFYIFNDEYYIEIFYLSENILFLVSRIHFLYNCSIRIPHNIKRKLITQNDFKYNCHEYSILLSNKIWINKIDHTTNNIKDIILDPYVYYSYHNEKFDKINIEKIMIVKKNFKKQNDNNNEYFTIKNNNISYLGISRHNDIDSLKIIKSIKIDNDINISKIIKYNEQINNIDVHLSYITTLTSNKKIYVNCNNKYINYDYCCGFYENIQKIILYIRKIILNNNFDVINEQTIKVLLNPLNTYNDNIIISSKYFDVWIDLEKTCAIETFSYQHDNKNYKFILDNKNVIIFEEYFPNLYECYHLSLIFDIKNIVISLIFCYKYGSLNILNNDVFDLVLFMFLNYYK